MAIIPVIPNGPRTQPLPTLPGEMMTHIVVHLRDWDALAALSQVSKPWRAIATDQANLFSVARQLGIERVELLVGERMLGDPQASLFLRIERVIKQIIIGPYPRAELQLRPASVTDAFLTARPEAMLRTDDHSFFSFCHSSYKNAVLITGAPVSLALALRWRWGPAFAVLELLVPEEPNERIQFLQNTPRNHRNNCLYLALEARASDYLQLFLDHGWQADDTDAAFECIDLINLCIPEPLAASFIESVIHPSDSWLALTIRLISDPTIRQGLVTDLINKGAVPNTRTIIQAFEKAPSLLPQLDILWPPEDSYDFNLPDLLYNTEMTPEVEEALSHFLHRVHFDPGCLFTTLSMAPSLTSTVLAAMWNRSKLDMACNIGIALLGLIITTILLPLTLPLGIGFWLLTQLNITGEETRKHIKSDKLWTFYFTPILLPIRCGYLLLEKLGIIEETT